MGTVATPASAAHPPYPLQSSRRVAQRGRNAGSSAIRDLLSLVDSDHVLSLAGGLPANGALPTAEVAAAVGTLLSSSADGLQYGATEGEPALRRWIAAHELGGVDPAHVVVTHGSQQALRLLVDALVDPGDVVVVERTSYAGMLQALAPSGAVVVDVPGDEHGMDTEAFEALLAAGARPTLCYLAPTFQNPTGTVLPSRRRRHLGALAREYGFVVIDDDPYRALAFEAPPERLRDHVPEDLAVTLGSFSKTVAPGLRVGWVHTPDWLVDPVVRLKQSADLQTSSLAQQVVHSLVADDGWFDTHIDAVRELYRHRASVLAGAIRRHLGVSAVCSVPHGGMFVWLTLPELDGDTDTLLGVALEEGVAFVPGSAFDPGGRPSRSARLCFATLDDHELDLAVERLSRAVARAGR